ncbi:adenosylcobinamide-phosphate synthase CbiB [Desulfosporosinus youngiae]|uniref:Cobalamin biosynthesis protein CobD n=1 Tax=Desulfosporosinus youngiae DSM 17734 TaxID=768710 RepID=H5Y432_9FIRM|nr:adenosylcobinamide-phosphate synthase CbiB [Desulfosporosinus youngiae]EHQ89713.1 cobalamin biosynthesis protein CobD [Desulfosporosinus youngiae DSM 17734]
MIETLSMFGALIPVAVLIGFILDQVIGDPPSWPHPVIGIGKGISFLEGKLNLGSPEVRRRNGVLLTLLIVGGSFLLTWGAVSLANLVHPILGFALNAYLIFTTLAGKSLLDAGQNVLVPLAKGDLSEARIQLSWLVSRDTTNLSEGEIARGTVETLAENFVDGILSPLFYAALGGAPLAMAFKAVSTLDSMVGYKNERYLDFGRFSARSDDWANYLPARLSVPILLLAGWLRKMPVSHAYRMWKRDAAGHPSPNGGNPESVVAGLLGIQLGGVNIYHGKIHHRAEMGDALHPVNAADIVHCRQLVWTATWLALIPTLILAYMTAYVI